MLMFCLFFRSLIAFVVSRCCRARRVVCLRLPTFWQTTRKALAGSRRVSMGASCSRCSWIIRWVHFAFKSCPDARKVFVWSEMSTHKITVLCLQGLLLFLQLKRSLLNSDWLPAVINTGLFTQNVSSRFFLPAFHYPYQPLIYNPSFSTRVADRHFCGRSGRGGARSLLGVQPHSSQSLPEVPVVPSPRLPRPNEVVCSVWLSLVSAVWLSGLLLFRRSWSSWHTCPTMATTAWRCIPSPMWWSSSSAGPTCNLSPTIPRSWRKNTSKSFPRMKNPYGRHVPVPSFFPSVPSLPPSRPPSAPPSFPYSLPPFLLPSLRPSPSAPPSVRLPHLPLFPPSVPPSAHPSLPSSLPPFVPPHLSLRPALLPSAPPSVIPSLSPPSVRPSFSPPSGPPSVCPSLLPSLPPYLPPPSRPPSVRPSLLPPPYSPAPPPLPLPAHRHLFPI